VSLFVERAERLEKITRNLMLRDDFPLLKSVVVPSSALARLRAAVDRYFVVTLDAWNPGQSYAGKNALLITAADAIRGLPNITPNGLVLPKRSNAEAYNEVHAATAGLLAELGLAPHIAQVHAPINLRLVDGRADKRFDARPRASVKWHSDMWAGEPASAVIAFLPVFGAPGALGVRWVEPRDFPTALARPLDDFQDGESVIDGGTEYKVAFDPGVLLLTDPFLVHKTMRDSDGLRLSIDFRFLSRYPVASDELAPGTRGENYLPYDEWAEIGRSTMLTTDAPLAAYAGPDVATSNEYAAPFTILRRND
jgi:hypothetical protein